jgi:S1-C subfamily serine protease
LETRPGQPVDVSLIRRGRRRQVELTLGTRPPPGQTRTG